MDKKTLNQVLNLVSLSIFICYFLSAYQVQAVKLSKRCRRKSTHRSGWTSDGGSGDFASETYNGKGTAWGASWTGGNCAFTQWDRPPDVGLIAMASNHWSNSGICGACLLVTGPGGNFTGLVMDQCPSCENDSLDLDSADFWNKVSGGQSPGIIDLSWKIVPCNFGKPMVLINKSGVSQYWTSIQVAGSNLPIEKLEVSTDGGGSWVEMIRNTNSNYFQYNDQGLGAKGDIRVTCQNGKQVLTEGVDLTIADTPVEASGNC